MEGFGINEAENRFRALKYFTEQIYKEFLEFNFRNSELRRKSDSIKWNLKKLRKFFMT